MISRTLLFLLLWLAVYTPGIAAGQQAGAPTAAPPVDDTFTTAQIAEKSLGKIRDGLQAHNSRQMLESFDSEHMRGYLAFKDQVEAFFAQYESFRTYIRLENATFEGDRAVVTAIFKLEGTPSYPGPEMRREAELTFELTRNGQDWKITGVSPRDFFS